MAVGKNENTDRNGENEFQLLKMKSVFKFFAHLLHNALSSHPIIGWNLYNAFFNCFFLAMKMD